MNKQSLIQFCDHLVFWPLALTFLLSPLFFLGITIQGIGFEKIFLFYVLTLVSLFAFGARALLNKKLELKKTKLDIFIFIFLFVAGISAAFSGHATTSLFGNYGSPERGLISIIFFVIFFFLLLNSINAKRVRVLFWAIVSSLGIVTLFSALQFLSLFVLPMQYTHQISFNPIGSLMDLSIFFVAGLPLLIAAIMNLEPGIEDKKQLFLKIGLWSVLVLNLLCLFALNDYIFWPIAILGMIMPLAFHSSGIYKIAKNKLYIYFGVLGVLFLFFAVSSLDLISNTLPPEAYLSRSASWDIAKQSIKENPVFGSGLGTFGAEFLKFKSVELNSTVLWNSTAENATGIFFEILATSGILGAVSALILILSIVYYSFLALPKTENKNISVALFAGFVIFFLLSLIYPLNSLLVLYFSLSAALLISLSAISSGNFKNLSYSLKVLSQNRLKMLGAVLPILLVVIFSGYLLAKVFVADAYALKAMTSENPDKAADLMKRAAALNPKEDFYQASLAKYHMNLANKQEGEAPKENKDIDAALGYAKKALELSDSAENNALLALVYEKSYGSMDNALDLARDHYQKAMALNPNFPYDMNLGFLSTVKLAYAQTEDDKKKFAEEALKLYSQALAKKGDLSEAYYGKSVVYKKMNDFDKYIEELEKALSLNVNIEYANELGRAYISRGIQNKATADLKKAEAVYLEIGSAVPDFFEARYNLAIVYRELGEKEKMDGIVKGMLEIVKDEKGQEMIKKEFEDKEKK